MDAHFGSRVKSFVEYSHLLSFHVPLIYISVISTNYLMENLLILMLINSMKIRTTKVKMICQSQRHFSSMKMITILKRGIVNLYQISVAKQSVPTLLDSGASSNFISEATLLSYSFTFFSQQFCNQCITTQDSHRWQSTNSIAITIHYYVPNYLLLR